MLFRPLAFTAAFSLTVYADHFGDICAQLSQKLQLPKSTINSVQHVLAGVNLTFPDYDPSCIASKGFDSQVISHSICRVALTVQTSHRSSTVVEVWLPQNWTGRVLATGNGGQDGCIKYDDMAYTTSLGFAAFGSNNGHNGTSGRSFYHNPDVVVDFAYRALHTSVVLGKQIASTFYNRSPTRSYYFGCSLGGRQGIKAALTYPADFDAIIAGAPATDFNNLYAFRARFLTLTGANTSASFITASQWTDLIHSAVLSQCDHLDGAVDGLISDTTRCTFRPEVLVCPANQTSKSCLTPRQVEIVHALQSPYYGSNNELIYSRLPPGDEIEASQQLFTGAPFHDSEQWFRYAVLEDPAWDPATFSLAETEYAITKNPGNISTWSGDLSAFRDRGGKLLVYHGLTDGKISTENSNRFYDLVAETMSLSSLQMDQFFRFFRIVGMNHCTGGVGPWQIGQLKSGAGMTPESNVILAMLDWLEQKNPPDVLVGRKLVDSKQPSKGVEYTRAHCRYPLRSVFVGGKDGDWKESNLWKCR